MEKRETNLSRRFHDEDSCIFFEMKYFSSRDLASSPAVSLTWPPRMAIPSSFPPKNIYFLINTTVKFSRQANNYLFHIAGSFPSLHTHTRDRDEKLFTQLIFGKTLSHAAE
ncbi:hypothetical protein CEXT_509251 [Caerostris extrusa]|uniref:Uncharacterized protein n=1 Tax=Caerostris extrusa TaxID=172846 RepID=A0AAV4WXR7_CAEEX|nr:hypothetical protein CEXT_509251 [Caerostris extrusa]